MRFSRDKRKWEEKLERSRIERLYAWLLSISPRKAWLKLFSTANQISHRCAGFATLTCGCHRIRGMILVKWCCLVHCDVLINCINKKFLVSKSKKYILNKHLCSSNSGTSNTKVMGLIPMEMVLFICSFMYSCCLNFFNYNHIACTSHFK